MGHIRTITSASSEDLAVRSGAALAVLIGAAIGERGSCALAVSGGSTPGRMFAELAHFDCDWSLVHLFQVDERVAPDGDPDRNATSLQRDLLSVVPLPLGNVHLMPVNDADHVAACARYSAELQAVCGGVLDVVHLGLGDDGHTASWPPQDPVVGITDADVAMAGPYRERLRMTLTPPAINRARQILWLVSGPDKVKPLQQLLAGDTSIPAGHVESARALLLADAAALRG